MILHCSLELRSEHQSTQCNREIVRYRGADNSLAPTRKETSSETRQGRVRFQQYQDASCHQVSFPARQSAEGNSRHSDRNISLFLSWSG